MGEADRGAGPELSASEVSFGAFARRVVAVHTTTYLVAGLLASNLMDYASWWATEELALYRPLDAPQIALGPAFQVVRGLVLAAVLFPFRHVFLRGWRGALELWGLLAGIGILSTSAAAPGSLEGVIYTRLPLAFHLFGAPEVYGQTLAFSLGPVGWHRRPSRAWGAIFWTGTLLAVGFGVLGVLFGRT